jgi:hypothetical protein
MRRIETLLHEIFNGVDITSLDTPFDGTPTVDVSSVKKLMDRFETIVLSETERHRQTERETERERQGVSEW